MRSAAVIIGVIPARFASTRLPAKPLIDLCGKPMIRRVYDRASASRLLSKLVVATDHPAIAETVRSFGGEAVMTSPDLPTGTDRVAAAVRDIGSFDIAVNIQGDEPLIDPLMIDQVCRLLIDDPLIKASTLVRKIDHADDLMNPATVKVALTVDGFAAYFSRSTIPYMRDGTVQKEWHLRHTYYKHIGLYGYRADLLRRFATWPQSPLEKSEMLEQLRLIEHGIPIRVAVTDYDSMPVDTAADVERMKKILEQEP